MFLLMFGDVCPQCLGMGIPGVWGWGSFKWKYEASPVFGDGRFKAVMISIKTFLWTTI